MTYPNPEQLKQILLLPDSWTVVGHLLIEYTGRMIIVSVNKRPWTSSKKWVLYKTRAPDLARACKRACRRAPGLDGFIDTVYRIHDICSNDSSGIGIRIEDMAQEVGVETAYESMGPEDAEWIWDRIRRLHVETFFEEFDYEMEEGVRRQAEPQNL
jgi:hypothetical protein